MKFYKVRKEFDNFPKNPLKRDGNIFIGDELYTFAQVEKLPFIYPGSLELVYIPINETFWSFGARFASEHY